MRVNDSPGISCTGCLALLALALLQDTPLATADAPLKGFWSLQLENDVWGSNDDRFYTHGTEISFAAIGRPKLAEKIVRNLPFYRLGDVGIYGFGLGQKIFTPEDIKQRELIETDRPYAGWLYLNAGVADLFDDRGATDAVNTILLAVGVVGPLSLAEQTQKEFHRLIDATIPQGWDNQLHNEPGIDITYLYKRRYLFGMEAPRQFELSYHGGLTLGNVYTYAAAGGMARWGSRLKNDIGPPTISPGFPGLPAFRPNPEFNWYLFAGVEERAVARNIFLDGNTFKDSHSVDKKPFVTDVQLGIAFHYRGVRFSFAQMFRSKEFDGQPEATQYGAINVTLYTD